MSLTHSYQDEQRGRLHSRQSAASGRVLCREAALSQNNKVFVNLLMLPLARRPAAAAPALSRTTWNLPGHHKLVVDATLSYTEMRVVYIMALQHMRHRR